jgi:hypothetical protein
MMRRIDMGLPVLLIAAWFLASTSLAQSTAAPGAESPPTAGQPSVEWAIAPERTRLPEGTVVEEGMVLPPGTILPGGAILPEFGAVAPPARTPGQSPAPEPLASPADESTSGVPHISGGVGVSGREAMERVKPRYNLRLLFAETGSGSYLSSVRVQIQDAAGPTLLTTVADGPWFYADLAPGDYILTVEYAGQVQKRRIVIPRNGVAAESFYWPNT